MKVLMINVSCGIGSTGRICTDLATSLEEKGHEVKIAFGRDKVRPQNKKYAVRIGSTFEVYAHALYARIFDASGLCSKKATIEFIQWVKDYNPDIIHLHNVHGYYINVPLLFEFLRTYGKPIIWTLHDCWAFTGHTAFCDYVDCEKWKNGCSKCPLLRGYPASYIDRSDVNWNWKKKAFTNIPQLSLITPSHWLKEQVKESFLSEYKVKVINNGIDTSIFKPIRSDFKIMNHIENKKIILGVASVWNEMKGLNDFISLSNSVSDDYAIVLVGLSKKQIRNLPSNIIGIEKTNSPFELCQIYNAADVFLNLTYCDNYPTTNLEARACGTPIITYNTGGSPESAGARAKVVEKGNIMQVLYELERTIRTEEPYSTYDNVKDVNATTLDYLELYK